MQPNTYGASLLVRVSLRAFFFRDTTIPLRPVNAAMGFFSSRKAEDNDSYQVTIGVGSSADRSVVKVIRSRFVRGCLLSLSYAHSSYCCLDRVCSTARRERNERIRPFHTSAAHRRQHRPWRKGRRLVLALVRLHRQDEVLAVPFVQQLMNGFHLR